MCRLLHTRVGTRCAPLVASDIHRNLVVKAGVEEVTRRAIDIARQVADELVKRARVPLRTRRPSSPSTATWPLHARQGIVLRCEYYLLSSVQARLGWKKNRWQHNSRGFVHTKNMFTRLKVVQHL